MYIDIFFRNKKMAKLMSAKRVLITNSSQKNFAKVLDMESYSILKE